MGHEKTFLVAVFLNEYLLLVNKYVSRKHLQQEGKPQISNSNIMLHARRCAHKYIRTHVHHTCVYELSFVVMYICVYVYIHSYVNTYYVANVMALQKAS